MRELIKLVSTADTGYYYTTDKKRAQGVGKLEKKKYDPVVRKHVLFKLRSSKSAGVMALSDNLTTKLSRGVDQRGSFNVFGAKIILLSSTLKGESDRG